LQQTIDNQVFKKLTKLYLTALLAVAILTLLGQLVIQLFLTELLDDAHVVNIAGRQRMLSQKLTKTATLICNPTIFPTKLNDAKNDLSEILTLWSKSHNGLMNGQLIIEKPVEVKNSDEINALFKQLNPIFNLIYSNAKLLTNQSEIPIDIQKTALTKILSNEKTFLKIMNNIVFEYDLEAQKRVNRTKSIEMILFILLFTVLVLEGAFIFKPIANNIRLIIKQLTESESKLQIANSDLIQSNSDLIEAKKELVKATEEKYKLQLAKEKIRSAALIEGQESERKRLALELHDGIGQMLTGLRLQTEHIKSFKFQNEKQSKSFAELQELVVETIEATRSVSFNLAPSVLGDFGLVPAIKLLAETNMKIRQIPIEVDSEFNKRIAEKIEIGLYRIVQEGLHNAQKHSKAKKIQIQLFEKNNEIILEISDNGIGFKYEKNKVDKKNLTIGSGINNMKTRVDLLNGYFSMKSEVNKGTSITVIVPILAS
jgi:signal transduction histidine kinase